MNAAGSWHKIESFMLQLSHFKTQTTAGRRTSPAMQNVNVVEKKMSSLSRTS
jgi:hypothetical protein